jgi:hypothetical protein
MQNTAARSPVSRSIHRASGQTLPGDQKGPGSEGDRIMERSKLFNEEKMTKT